MGGRERALAKNNGYTHAFGEERVFIGRPCMRGECRMGGVGKLRE